ncbi:MAG: PAS domain S-box protein [Syntrophobacterales bacterium]|nr:PAS domain S-box protein [Syntrophobacterales bacterium]
MDKDAVTEKRFDGEANGIGGTNPEYSPEIDAGRLSTEELRYREHKFRTLIESTQDLVFTVDRQGFFTYLNPHFEKVIGYRTAELMGSPFTRIIDPDSWEKVKDRFKSGMRGAESLPYEVNVVHKNGRLIPVEFLVTTLHDERGNAVGRYGIGRDITIRLEAEKARRESEQKLYSVIQGLTIPTFFIGTDHRIVYWNRALEAMSKISAEEVIGTTEHWRAFYDAERPCLADLLLDGRLEELPQRYCGKCRKSELIEGAYEVNDFFPHLGERGKWLRFTGTTVRDLSGNLVGALETLEDISDQKQAEEATKAAETLYRTLAERSFAGVYVVQKGRFRFISSNAASYAGYTREELLGQRADMIVAAADRDKARENARAMLAGELLVPYEFRIVTKQGDTRWIMETVTSIVYDGEPAILGNSMDITGRKEAAEALRESEERYRTLFNNANDAIFILKDYKFIDCNDVTLKMYGCTREQIIGRTPDELSPPCQPDGSPSREKAREKIEAALGGEPQRFEWRHCRMDGTVFDAEISLNALTIGEETMIQAFVRDITARKQVEEQLRHSEERYRNIIENIEDGYFEVDLKGNMTFVNPSTSRILGYTKEELIGLNYRRYMDEENARKVFTTFNLVFRTGMPTRAFDWELINREGDKIFVETSVSLVRDGEGKPTGFRGIMRDITERKRLEAEIRELSLRDHLTGLYNRRGFITLAEQQFKMSQRTSRSMMIVFIDIDGMKGINDTLGHKIGDQALIDTAQILRQTFRGSDIVARIGGDEFAVMAIDAVEFEVSAFSQRLLRNIAEINAEASRPFRLAMSWGTALYNPEKPVSLDQLMSSADELMYRHKKAKIKNELFPDREIPSEK